MFCGAFMGQAQQKNYINYQGVARNSDNELMEQETIDIGIALKFGSADADAQYEESHSITTDANGVFNLQIGSGNSNSGSYSNLPWGQATFVVVSFNGVEVGTTELMAVPYSMASGSQQWETNGNDIENKNVGEVKIKSDLRILGGFNLNSGNQVNEISDDGGLAENSNGILPTQRAVKTYVDNRLFSGGGGGDAQIASEVPYNNVDSGLTAGNVQEALDEIVATAGGGADADADPTNEIQDISLSGTDLSITDGSTIDLSAIIPPGETDDQNASEVPFDNTGTGLAAADTQAAIEELASGGLVDTDDQNLSLSGTMLQIDDGTGVDLSTIIPPGGTDDQNASEVPFDNTGTGLAAADTQAAIEELAAGGLVDTDDQNLSLSGTMLQIDDGTGVDLSTIIPPGGTDDQEALEVPFDNTGTGLAAVDTQAAIEELAAGGLVDTDDQDLVLTGDVLSIEDGVGSVDFSDYFNRTTRHGLLVGDDGIIDGLVGTADGQVAKWDAALGNWVAGTDEVGGGGGSSLWSENGSDIYFDSGKVGLGTASPTSDLHISSTSTSPLILETSASDNWLRFANSNGYIGYAGIFNGDKDMDFGTGSFNATGKVHLVANAEPKLTVIPNGNVGVGTVNPSTGLHISTGQNNPLILETSRPENWLRFDNSNGYIGYAGIYTGDKDMDFGTGVLNTTGKVHLVTNATPKLTIIPNGNVGVGTVNPTTKLDVNGEIKVSGEMRRGTTGTTDMLPIAYGYIDDNTDILSGSGNFTIEKTATGLYTVAIPNEEDPKNWTVLTTINHTVPAIASVSHFSSGARKFNVNTWRLNSTRADFSFSFVVYKK